MTDSEKLLTLAKWFDVKCPNDPNTEVQDDLRAIAAKITALRAENTGLRKSVLEMAARAAALECVICHHTGHTFEEDLEDDEEYCIPLTADANGILQKTPNVGTRDDCPLIAAKREEK